MVRVSPRAIVRLVFFVGVAALLYHVATAILFPGAGDDGGLDLAYEGLGTRINDLGVSVWRAGEERLGWETLERPPPPEVPEVEEVVEDEGHHSYDDTREDGLSEEEAALLESHDGDSKEEIGIIAEHKDAPPQPPKPNDKEPQTKDTATEVVLRDLKHYIRINDEERAQHLVLIVAQDERSWGSPSSGAPRSAEDHIRLLQTSSGLELASVSLAILTTSEELYDELVSSLSVHNLAKYQVLLWTPPALQAEALEAQARNTLLLRALETEPHVFVLSPDVSEMEQGIMAKILEHGVDVDATVTANRSLAPAQLLPLGVVTALTRPIDEGTWLVHQSAESLDTEDRLGMQDLVQWTETSELVPLSSVGGALLYVRADLVRLGLVFPTFKVGDDNGATGLCYAAEAVGTGCYGLGGDWSVEVVF